jgi:hypothetical protein
MDLFRSREASIQYALGFVEYSSMRCMEDIVEWESFICFLDLNNALGISLASFNEDILL